MRQVWPSSKLLRIRAIIRDGDQLAGFCRYAQTHPNWVIEHEPRTPEALARLVADPPDALVTGMNSWGHGFTWPTHHVSVDLFDSTPWRVFPCSAAQGQLAAEHLFQNGLRHFAAVDAADLRACQARLNAFCGAIQEHGLEVRRLPTPIHRNEVGSYILTDPDALLTDLEDLPRPCGLVVHRFDVGLEVLRIARNYSGRIPEDLAVIACSDNPLLAELSQPPLSGVSLLPERVGYQAGNLLARSLAGEEPPDAPIAISPDGVNARRSSDHVAVSDPAIAGAIRFMRDHARQLIQVSDVLDHIAIDRRRMERGFRKALGLTPAAYLAQLRIELVKAMLLNTDLPTHAIADRCGFTNAQRLHEAFKRLCGQTPGQFRKGLRIMPSTSHASGAGGR